MTGQLDLLNAPARQTADTSLLAFDRLQPLKDLDLRWLLRVYAYLRDTGTSDVAGGELAEHFDVSVTSTRPRLTSCYQRGWLTKGPIRSSTVRREGSCRGYRPTVPRDAVERAQKEAQRIAAAAKSVSC